MGDSHYTPRRAGYDGHGGVELRNADGDHLGYTRMGTVNAEKALMAIVNSHADLLAACERLMSDCPADPDATDKFLEAWRAAEAAIAKAKGGN